MISLDQENGVNISHYLLLCMAHGIMGQDYYHDGDILVPGSSLIYVYAYGNKSHR